VRAFLMMLGIAIAAYLFLPHRGEINLRSRLRRLGRALVLALVGYWVYLLLIGVSR
jgi:hypothetical protein